MVRQPAIYMMTNKKDGVIYTGVTSDLIKRVFEHKNGVIKSFSQKYNCDKLVYFELYETMPDAIAREKQLKGGSRKKKVALIEAHNAIWKDIYNDII